MSGDADADKDGRISVLEAFTYAQKEVVRAYESERKLLTEHAQVSGDTVLARTIAFGGVSANSDPRVIALVRERQTLELQAFATLRAKKASMDSTALCSLTSSVC